MLEKNLPLYTNLQRWIRRHLQNETIYRLLRRTLLVSQYLFRQPDEPDYAALRALPRRNSGLIIDIGANGGQSAIAFSFLCPDFDILSFEPNPSLWPDLEFVKCLLGERYDFRPVGLGSERDSITLYVPHQGQLPITARATLDPDMAERQLDELQQDLGERGHLEEIEVEILALDELNLRPDAVKIDVEGHELSVLEGMEQTIAACRPVLVIERNRDSDACRTLLKKFDYEFLYFDLETHTLGNSTGNASHNWYAIPSEKVAVFN